MIRIISDTLRTVTDILVSNTNISVLFILLLYYIAEYVCFYIILLRRQKALLLRINIS